MCCHSHRHAHNEPDEPQVAHGSGFAFGLFGSLLYCLPGCRTVRGAGSHSAVGVCCAALTIAPCIGHSACSAHGVLPSGCVGFRPFDGLGCLFNVLVAGCVSDGETCARTVGGDGQRTVKLRQTVGLNTGCLLCLATRCAQDSCQREGNR